MPLISQEDRGHAVGLITSGPPKQKTHNIFYFIFYIFYSFLCTVRYMHNLISLIFNCIRHVCLTDTTSHFNNCDRSIWQPEVLPERRVIKVCTKIFTQNIFTSSGAWSLRKVCLKPFFGFMDVTFPLPRLTDKTGAR